MWLIILNSAVFASVYFSNWGFMFGQTNEAGDIFGWWFICLLMLEQQIMYISNWYLNYIWWLLAGIIFWVEHIRIVSAFKNYTAKDKSNTIQNAPSLCITNESTDSCTCSVIICHTKMAHDNHILCHQLWVMWYVPESHYDRSYRPLLCKDCTALLTAQE